MQPVAEFTGRLRALRLVFGDSNHQINAMSEIIDRLEARLVRYFERYAARRVALAAFLSGLLSIGAALLVLSVTTSLLYAVLVFIVVGFLLMNLLIFFLVPSVKELAEAQALICGAVRYPERIKNFDTKSVKLSDESGKTRELKKIELNVWQTLIFPFLVKLGRKVERVETVLLKNDSAEAGEREEVEARRQELLEAEKKIEQERRRMQDQYLKIEEKMAELSEAEGRAAQLQAKEQEEADASVERSGEEREAKIAAREKEIAELREALEAERADLQERAAYVETVEESLVDRLNELSSREAEIEQGEINAGIRKD
jgi:hypothetical protein